jgi:hypothetical protein
MIHEVGVWLKEEGQVFISCHILFAQVLVQATSGTSAFEPHQKRDWVMYLR